jgi:hypothetical protein
MNYHTVFDAANQGFWNPAYNVVFVISAVGALIVFLPNLMQRLMPNGAQGAVRTGVGWILFLAPLVIGGYFIVGNHQAYQRAAETLKAGNFQVAEGPVTGFVPMPYEGHAMESFTVRGHTFRYSDYILTPGFHNTTSHGGPIREGLNVRVSFVNNLILRLEVAQ